MCWTPGIAPPRRGGAAAAGRAPPLPDAATAARARAWATRACSGGCCGAAAPFGASAVSTTVTPVTPASSFTTFSAACRKGSSSRARSAGTVIENATRPSRTSTSDTIPRSTMLPERSGPLMRRSASSTSGLVTDMTGNLVPAAVAAPLPRTSGLSYTRRTRGGNAAASFSLYLGRPACFSGGRVCRTFLYMSASPFSNLDTLGTLSHGGLGFGCAMVALCCGSGPITMGALQPVLDRPAWQRTPLCQGFLTAS